MLATMAIDVRRRLAAIRQVMPRQLAASWGYCFTAITSWTSLTGEAMRVGGGDNAIDSNVPSQRL
jgi:hypothetical protein